MRSRHLRWTWAPVALAVVVLARSVIGGAAASTLGTAALCATVRGRRWHREDLDAGADLAEIAAERRGPLDAARTVVRRSMPRLLALIAPKLPARWAPRIAIGAARTDWFRADRLIVGEEENGRPVSIALGGPTGGTHTLVVGAAGSGKTVTMTWMSVRSVEHGMGAIVLDPKGDRDLRRELRDAAHIAGRPFVEWTPQGPSVYNPYARGSATEIADKALAGERFTEPHYLRQAQRYLGHAVRVLRRSGLEVSLQVLVDHLDPSRLELLARTLPESDAQGVHDYLDSLTKRQQSDLTGVRDRLAIMAESDLGCWLDPRTPGGERFDLLEAVKARAVVYFGLGSRPPAAARPDARGGDRRRPAGGGLGAAGPARGNAGGDRRVSAIVPERVVGLFGRARGAGVSLVPGTQELSDCACPGGRCCSSRSWATCPL